MTRCGPAADLLLLWHTQSGHALTKIMVERIFQSLGLGTGAAEEAGEGAEAVVAGVLPIVVAAKLISA